MGPLLRMLAPRLPRALAGPRGAGNSMWSSLSSPCGSCWAAAMRPSMRWMSGRQAGLACQALRIIRALLQRMLASISMLALHEVARTTSGHLMDWCFPVSAFAVWPCSLRSALTLSGVASTPYNPMAYPFPTINLPLVAVLAGTARMRSMMVAALSTLLLRVVPVGAPLMVRWEPRSRTLCMTCMLHSVLPHFWRRSLLRCSAEDASVALLVGEGLPPMSCMYARVAFTAVVRVSSMSLSGLAGWQSLVRHRNKSSARVRGIVSMCFMSRIHGLVMRAKIIMDKGHPCGMEHLRV